jgi:hypothetical protein
MFEKLLKQWANEQGFQTWSQDHAAVLRNLSSWLNTHAVEQLRALDTLRCEEEGCKKPAVMYYCETHAP